jgi:hypothetical protein
LGRSSSWACAGGLEALEVARETRLETVVMNQAELAVNFFVALFALIGVLARIFEPWTGSRGP